MKRTTAILLLTAIFIISIIPADAVSVGVINVSSAECGIGDEVGITISLDSNPGLWSLAFFVEFDNSVLDCTNYDLNNCLFSGRNSLGYCILNEEKNLIKYNYMSANIQSDRTSTGNLLNIKFRLKEKAEAGSSYPVKITIDTNNCINVQSKLVPMTVGKAGFISVKGNESGNLPDSYIRTVGYQRSNDAGSSYSIRLISVIDGKDHKAVGMSVTGDNNNGDHETRKLFTRIYGSENSSTNEVLTAGNDQYLYTTELEDLQYGKEYIFSLCPFSVEPDGKRYTGNVMTIHIGTDGSVTAS